MAAEDFESTAQAGYFVIADISGYTGFLANNDLTHAQGILREITELLIENLSAPFRFVELEGDAVFVFAPAEAVEDSERLVDIMEACYAAFRLRLEQMATNTSCECTACRAIPDLDLKCVAHFGEYVPQPTPTGTKLVGPEVIRVHRLLKNTVIERTGIRSYALLSDAFIENSSFGTQGLGLQRHVEEYADLGAVQGRVLDLSAALDHYRAAARRYVGPEDADLEIRTELPVPRSLAWGYFIDARRRRRWQLDTTSVENQASPSGRTGIGWESHCDHGSYRMNHRVIDWQPLEYVSMATVSSGRSIKKPPEGYVTFELDDLPQGRSALHFRVRTRNRGLPMKILFSLVKPVIKREWEEHFAVLVRVLLEDVSRAEDAVSAS
jgi:uncharacterized protein YndB with AHSA1/START domain